MLVIGNIYGHGFGREEAAAIEHAGFAVRAQPHRRAGGTVSRFVDFEDGPALELVEVENPRAYLDAVPDGMMPYAPGVSLIVPSWAERDLSDFARRHAVFRPYPTHAAYDGSGDASRPGWNHLNFATPLFPGVFVWLSQLDDPQPRRALVPRHPNGALGVRGIVLEGKEGCLRNLARIAEVVPTNDAVTIEGVTLWPRASLDDVPRISGKAFPLLAVVIEMPDLNTIPREIRETHGASFGSQPAVHVPTNDLAWDLVLTEVDPTHPARRFPTIAAEPPRYVRRALSRPR